MHKFNLELCQALLSQTNSIDEAARLMAVDDNDKHRGFNYWRDNIIKAINKKELSI
ncbi:hypothetical protein NVP1060A_63 [Vibrio phage 1.060.A._10N.261.48.B5]|nr:hypothetical protein NVP1060A_63 [Vibrio phage 1.060.A._10N.261.48.B5]